MIQRPFHLVILLDDDTPRATQPQFCGRPFPVNKVVLGHLLVVSLEACQKFRVPALKHAIRAMVVQNASIHR